MKSRFVRLVTLCLVIVLALFTMIATPAFAKKEADEGDMGQHQASGGASVQALPPRIEKPAPTPAPGVTPTPRPDREPVSPDSGKRDVAGDESPSLPDRHSDA